MMELKFDEKGLIPAIVQDYYTKQVDIRDLKLYLKSHGVEMRI